MRLILLSLLSLIVPLNPALALDPGTAKGFLQVNNERIQLDHAYAHLHDNAEQLLDNPKELRILLSDREVPPPALAGIAFLPVERMAKEGRVQGLLLQMNPNDNSRVVVTLLYPPAAAGESLMTQSISVSGQKSMKRFEFSAQRVVGEIEHSQNRESTSSQMPTLAYSASFSAPLFHEPPVTADLKGKAALDSPQAQVLRERTRALAKGDFDTVRRLSTERSNRVNAPLLAQDSGEARSFAKQAAAEMEESIKNIRRVVVRGDHAVVLLSNNAWVCFAREAAQWKSDD